METTRWKAWGKAVLTFIVIGTASIIYNHTIGGNDSFQDTVNITLGIIVMHLLTDKYEKEK